MSASKSWALFLRIPPANTSDEAPRADAEFLAARGIAPTAPIVVELLRDEVLPLVRKLQRRRGLERFHFLVHDRESGVPTTADDHGEYIHLSLTFSRPVSWPLFVRDGARRWQMVRPVDFGNDSAGGWDTDIVSDGKADTLRALLDAQSAWVLDFVEAHNQTADVLAVVRQARQFLHYYSNMLQMRVQ